MVFSTKEEKMARKIKVESKCPMCKCKYDTMGYTIRQGMLQDVFIIDKSFCSDECEDKFNILLEKNDSPNTGSGKQ